MRTPQLSVIVFLSVFVCGASNGLLAATEGYWQRVDYDYSGIFEPLPGYTEWHLHQMRGPDDRWVVDLTISGYGFNPLTVIVSDAMAYEHWNRTSSTSNCVFVEFVNTSLEATVDLPYPSEWYFVMNNTGPGTLYFTLSLTRYHWSIELPSTTTREFFVTLGSLIGYFVIVAIVVVVLIPCLCGCGCSRRKRGRRRRAQDSEVHHHYTTYLVVSPDNIRAQDLLRNEEEP